MPANAFRFHKILGFPRRPRSAKSGMFSRTANFGRYGGRGSGSKPKNSRAEISQLSATRTRESARLLAL